MRGSGVPGADAEGSPGANSGWEQPKGCVAGIHSAWYDEALLAIRVIFDGKAFVPQQPVALPDRSEAIVIVDQSDPAAQASLDAEDEDWAKATAPQSRSAWEED